MKKSLSRYPGPKTAALVAATLFAATSLCQASTVAYWNFEEGSAGQTASTVIDVSGNGHNGTALNGPVYQNSPDGGLGLQFDGVNDRIFIADSADFVSNSLTVEAAVQIDSYPGNEILNEIVFRGDQRNGLDPFFLAIRSQQLFFGITDASGFAFVQADISLDVLHHVAGVIDDVTGTLQLYIDGSVVASKTTSVRPTLPLTTFNPGLGIGNLQTFHNQYFDGRIDEVRISDVALGANQLLGALPPPSGIPEPASLALMGLGLVGIGFGRKKRLR